MALSPTVKSSNTWSSHQLSGKVKNAWSYAYTPAYVVVINWPQRKLCFCFRRQTLQKLYITAEHTTTEAQLKPTRRDDSVDHVCLCLRFGTQLCVSGRNFKTRLLF
jgi:hypothetical protein